MVPDDFTGLVPKLEVKQGDRVRTGTPLFRDKTGEMIKAVSPVCGTVREILRGQRRKIEGVIIDRDGADEALEFDNSDPEDPRCARQLLFASGLWAYMRQRPYDIVPAPDSVPRDIFVTAFDSAPLAPDLGLAVKDKSRQINAGIRLLKALTHGQVYLCVRKGADTAALEGAVIVEVAGPHPAGNPGIQAANISPVNKGETIWTLDIVTLARIGHVALSGRLDNSALVAVTGSEVETPQYVKTVIGASMAGILRGNVKNDGRNHRVISGNVLTGFRVEQTGYLRFPYRQVTVIPEGDDVDEFMGWASLSVNKMSASRSFPSSFFRRRLFAPDARILGGRRAMIMSGEYDRVLPMDIMAEFLLKAIISRDIDKMENLGIYEIAPEDFALCEYVDTSKLEIQKIVREGLDYLRGELE